jgi:ribonuclease BN (tRNA processing enzyme)
MAKNADLLIHEVILNSLLDETIKVLENKNMQRNAHIIKDIQDYHTPPDEIIRLANKVNVKTLVLNHLVPSPDNIIIKKLYDKYTKKFKGNVYLANDGDKFIIK